ALHFALPQRLEQLTPVVQQTGPISQVDQLAEDRGLGGGVQVQVDRFEADLEPLKQFILPAGADVSARLHFARTVCRRAERRVVSLQKQPGVKVRKELLVA
ncbi:MAG: ATP:cob(I)alamin adenosyltransferase, partial [Chloroflexi bacterium]|nr:ATP:cob(I)alamin adenosyltransferase [Chloroflexota bacterium]